jgi:thiol-disulfide isomerase/thioredoxin
MMVVALPMQTRSLLLRWRWWLVAIALLATAAVGALTYLPKDLWQDWSGAARNTAELPERRAGRGGRPQLAFGAAQLGGAAATPADRLAAAIEVAESRRQAARPIKHTEKEFNNHWNDIQSIVSDGGRLPERAGDLAFECACWLVQSNQLNQAEQALMIAYQNGLVQLARLNQDPRLEPLRQSKNWPSLRTTLVDKLAESLDFDWQLARPADSMRSMVLKGSDRSGRVLATDQFQGKELVAVVWASYSPSCDELFRELVQLSLSMRETKIQFVAINFEPQRPVDQRSSAIEQLLGKIPGGTQAPIDHWFAEDLFGQSMMFKVYPTILFFDAAGKLRLRLDGPQAEGVIELCAQRLLPQ